MSKVLYCLILSNPCINKIRGSIPPPRNEPILQLFYLSIFSSTYQFLLFAIPLLRYDICFSIHTISLGG